MLSESRHRLAASDLRVREMEEGHQGRMSQLLDGTLKVRASLSLSLSLSLLYSS